MSDSIGRCAVHGGEISRVAPEKREIRENHLRAARYDASVSCVGGRDSIRSAGYLRPDTFYMYVHMYVRVYTHACKLYLYYLANFTRQGTARHATRPAAGIKSFRDLSETSSQCKFRGERGIFIVRKNQVCPITRNIAVANSSSRSHPCLFTSLTSSSNLLFFPSLWNLILFFPISLF